jgi:hypothetical protein
MLRRNAVAVLVIMTTQAQAHDWYKGTKDPSSGAECCGDFDCHVVDAVDIEVLGGGDYRYLPRNWFIARSHVQEAKDDNYHICEPSILPQGLDNWHGRPFPRKSMLWTCFFVPKLSN